MTVFTTTAPRRTARSFFRDDGNQLRRGDHADLHASRTIAGVQLLRQEMGLDSLRISRDAGGVLGRQGRDRAGGEYARWRERYRPESGASAGIRFRQWSMLCFHCSAPFSMLTYSTVL